ncbi:hypothetical protein DRQ50_04635 [bacterium]|nr:MAG: hypothetical protein DRQ50_04635 [bacterium]
MAGILLVWAAVATAADDAGLRSVFARGAGERALGLGGAYGAVADDATAAFWNPAGLGLLKRTEFQASHTDLIGLGFYEQYGTVAVPSWRLGTFAVSLRRFGVDGIEGRDDRGGITDPDLENTESELGFAYGRSLGEIWSVGAAFKYQQQNVAGYTGNGLGLDVGVLARPFVAGGVSSPVLRSVRVGLTLRNIVEPNVRLLEEDVPDPTGMRLGTAFQVPVGERVHMMATADLEKTRDMGTEVHAGLEMVLLDLLALRVGSNDGTLAAGAGVRWRDLAFNYAFEDNEIDTVHRFGLGITFGSTTDERRLADQEKVEREINDRLAQAFRTDNERRIATLVAETKSALAQEDHARALEQVRVLHVLAPDHPEADALEVRALLATALAAESEDDLAAAALAFQQCLRVDPGKREARSGLNRVNAESDLRTARSSELRAVYDIGLAAFAAGELDSALVAFEQVTRLDTSDEEARRLLGHVQEAILTREKIAAARKQAADDARVRKAAQTPPPAPSTAVAVAESPAVEVPATVAPSFESMSLKERAEIADLYRRGVDASEAGRRADAIRCWELVLSAEPDYRQVADHLKQEYLAQGMEAFADGRLNRAIDLWEKAKTVAPNDPRVNGYLERAYEHKARIRTAGRPG